MINEDLIKEVERLNMILKNTKDALKKSQEENQVLNSKIEILNNSSSILNSNVLIGKY